MEIGRFAFLRMHGSLDGKVMLEDELQRIYDSEINVRISWLWDGGIDVRLGDEMNGYLAEENVSSTGISFPGFKSRLRTSTLIPCTRNLGPADQRARNAPAVPAAHQWRSSAMPGMRRATCISGRNGGGIRVCLLALRKGCGSTAT